MNLVGDDILDFQNTALQSTSLSNKSKFSWLPFLVSRMRSRVARHLFHRKKRRSAKGRLTTNMDSYNCTPSDNELQQLLHA